MEESLGNDPAGLIGKAFELPDKDIRGYSPLTLAFIGDSIYEVIVRTILVKEGQRPVNAYNKEKIKYVSARAQADIARRLEEVLTEEEKEVMRRGRSSKTAHRAKNATLSDYHLATGFEALCGYLYLAGKTDRLLELVKMSREGEDEEEI